MREERILDDLQDMLQYALDHRLTNVAEGIKRAIETGKLEILGSEAQWDETRPFAVTNSIKERFGPRICARNKTTGTKHLS